MLAFEGLGPIDALKRSAGLFKSRFGEVAVGRGAIGLAVFLAGFVPALALLGLGFFVGGTSIALAAIFWIAALLVVVAAGIIGSTLTQIFNTALYRYATDGSTPLGFAADDFDGLVKPA